MRRNKDIASVLDHEVGKEVILYEAFEEESEQQQNVEKRYIKKDDEEFVSIFCFCSVTFISLFCFLFCLCFIFCYFILFFLAICLLLL